MGSDPQENKPSASDIYQAHLDRMTRAVLAGDYDAFSCGLRYPWQTQTLTHQMTIPDKAAGLEDFLSFYNALEADEATDLIRLVETAEFVSPTVIVGTHLSHRMRGGTRILGPYHNRLRLEHDDINGWRETECANAVQTRGQDHSVYVPTSGQVSAPDLNTDSERNKE